MKIEKNIPLPVHQWSEDLPFGEMEIGDCLTIEINEGEDSRSKMQWVCYSFWKFNKDKFPKWKFKAFGINEDGKKLIRVWRVLRSE